MGAGLLPGDVEAPPPHEPLQDLARLHRQVRTPQGLGRTCALRIADEPPAPGQGRHPSVRPHRGVRAPLDHPLALTIPATHRHGWPASGRVGQDVGPGRQPRALQAGATRLPRCPRRRGFLPCRIQTQTGEATEGIRQLAPAPPQRHDGEAALGDEPEAALWYPAPPHQEPVSGPIGQLLVPLAPFLRGALGRRHYRPEWPRPHPSGPRNGDQPPQAQPAPPAGFHQRALGRAPRLTRAACGPDRRAPASL